MAYSYRWSDLVNLVKASVKNAPIDKFSALHADMVSSKMLAARPWTPTIATIAEGEIPLVDGTQDYSVPPEIYRLVPDTVYLLRTDVTPNDAINLDLLESLAVDLQPRSPYSVRNVSHEPGVGLLRLEFATKVPEGQSWEIRGQYQMNQQKVSDLAQRCWFDDKYAEVAVKGLMYWAYRLVDDPRAGASTEQSSGNFAYSGVLGEFMAAIREMARAEDTTGSERAFPAEPLGQGTNWGVWPFGV